MRVILLLSHHYLTLFLSLSLSLSLVFSKDKTTLQQLLISVVTRCRDGRFYGTSKGRETLSRHKSRASIGKRHLNESQHSDRSVSVRGRRKVFICLKLRMGSAIVQRARWVRLRADVGVEIECGRRRAAHEKGSRETVEVEVT